MWLKDSTPTSSNTHTFTAKLKRPKIFESSLIIADFTYSSRIVINSKIDFDSSLDMSLLHNIAVASKIDFSSVVNLVTITNLKINSQIDFSGYVDLAIESYIKLKSSTDFSSALDLLSIKNIATNMSIIDFESSTSMNMYKFSRLNDFYQDNNGKPINWMYGQSLNELSFTKIV